MQNTHAQERQSIESLAIAPVVVTNVGWRAADIADFSNIAGLIRRVLLRIFRWWGEAKVCTVRTGPP